MAHWVQQIWCEKIKKLHPQYFKNKRVVDVGSLDVNGNNKYLFDDCEYYGIDVIPGPNVDVVCIAHQYIVDKPFDVAMSTNALEHDMFWKQTIPWMFSSLNPGGLLFFSAASTHFEHGTKRTTPEDSGTSQMGIEWENYYHNISEVDIQETVDWSNLSKFEMTLANVVNNSREMDLRFWGIKKG